MSSYCMGIHENNAYIHVAYIPGIVWLLRITSSPFNNAIPFASPELVISPFINKLKHTRTKSVMNILSILNIILTINSLWMIKPIF